MVREGRFFRPRNTRKLGTWNGNVANVIVLPIASVANCQFILSQRLNRDRVSFPNLVNPVNPVKKLRLSALASLGVKKMGIL